MTGVHFYHVEWNDGMISGKFAPDREAAIALAQRKATKTKNPATVTPVWLSSVDAISLVGLINDTNSNALVWSYDNATIVEP